MYIYEGKQLDFFEDAIKMLLVNSNYTEIEDIDCISLRNASFINSGNIRFWFKSGISVCESLKNIEYALNADELFSVKKLTEKDFDINRILGKNRPFVLGPISKRKLLQKIDANYYDGERNYIYCFSYNGELFIHEPDGVPFLMVDAKDYSKMFEQKDYLFQICVNSNIEISAQNRIKVLKNWLEAKRASRLSLDDVSNYNYTKLCNMNIADEISFGFAAKNYLIQISKMFKYLEKNSEFNQNCKVFKEYASELNDITFNKHYERINTLIKNIDDYLISSILEEVS